MNTYIGSSYILPSALSFVTFITWMVVLSRMTNLQRPRSHRIVIFVWALAILWIAVDDLERNHVYYSYWGVIESITIKTLRQLGSIGAAVYVYILLGKAYPLKMACSIHEPTPKIGVVVTQGERQ